MSASHECVRHTVLASAMSLAVLTGAHAAPTAQIASYTPTVHIDTQGATQTMLDGIPWEGWLDGPCHPYRKSATDVTRCGGFLSENFWLYMRHRTFDVPSFSPTIMHSARNPDLTRSDFRHWITGVFSTGSRLWGMAHSENYTTTFRGASGVHHQDCHNSQHVWFNGLSVFKNTGRNGNHDIMGYWLPSPTPWSGQVGRNEHNLILHPALPENARFRGCHLTTGYAYGFMQPTNPIDGGDGYVYVFAQHYPVNNPSFKTTSTEGDIRKKAGAVLLRVPKSRIGSHGNPSNLNGSWWQIYNSNRQWQWISRFQWADASIAGGIVPHVFHRGSYSTHWYVNGGAVQAVRRVGGKYVTFGVQYPGRLVYSYTDTLGDPRNLDNLHVFLDPGGNNAGSDGRFNLQAAKYMSVVDPYNDDLNYKYAAQGTARVRVMIVEDHRRVVSYPIMLTGF